MQKQEWYAATLRSNAPCKQGQKPTQTSLLSHFYVPMQRQLLWITISHVVVNLPSPPNARLGAEVRLHSLFDLSIYHWVFQHFIFTQHRVLFQAHSRNWC